MPAIVSTKARIRRNDPPPVPQPPPTYDLIDLPVSEMQSLVMVCYHATTFVEYLKESGFYKGCLSVDLNRLYHVIKTEVPHP